MSTGTSARCPVLAKPTQNRCCPRSSKARSATARRRSNFATSRSSARSQSRPGRRRLPPANRARLELHRALLPKPGRGGLRLCDRCIRRIDRQGGECKRPRQWNEDRKSKPLIDKVSATTAEAENLGFTGTPSFAVKGPGVKGLETLTKSRDGRSDEEAIKERVES